MREILPTEIYQAYAASVRGRLRGNPMDRGHSLPEKQVAYAEGRKRRKLLRTQSINAFESMTWNIIFQLRGEKYQ